jgi:spermidine synthase
MADARVTIVNQDVIEVMRTVPGRFDTIILDVDNGPDALTTGGNAQLYSDSGLRLTRRALKPEGSVAFWSAVPDTAFEKLLARAGFTVEVHRCRAHIDSGGWRTLFLGRR